MELETLKNCNICQGAGGWKRDDGSWSECPVCDGLGKTKEPSEEGLNLLRFVRKHFDLEDKLEYKIEEVIDAIKEREDQRKRREEFYE